MDGHFVPNITMGAPVLASVHKTVDNVFMDCHMMVADPAKVRLVSRLALSLSLRAPADLAQRCVQWVKPVAEAGGKSYTFHIEALSHPGPSLLPPSFLPSPLSLTPSTPAESAHELVELIHSTGMRAAVAISPDTPSSAISDKLGESVDMLLVMTVVPGAPCLSLSFILVSSRLIPHPFLPFLALSPRSLRSQAPAAKSSCSRASPRSPSCAPGSRPRISRSTAASGRARSGAARVRVRLVVPLVPAPLARLEPALEASPYPSSLTNASSHSPRTQARTSSSPARPSSAPTSPPRSSPTSSARSTTARASGAPRRRSTASRARSFSRGVNVVEECA